MPKTLDLSEQVITDISFLANRTDLEELNLARTKITDESIQVISKLINLRILNIADTKITKLDFVALLQKLEKFDISGAPIINLSPLSHLHCLECLTAHDTDIYNLSPLETSISLHELGMERSQVNNYSLRYLPKNFKIIDFYGCKYVDNLKPLSELKNLEVLCIKDTGLLSPMDLYSLKNLTKLKELLVEEEDEWKLAAENVLSYIEENRKKALTDFFGKISDVVHDSPQPEKLDQKFDAYEK